MFEEIVFLFTTAGAACSVWLTAILVATGSLTFVTGCIAVTLAIRHFLGPLVCVFPVGGAGSDTAHKTEDDRHRAYFRDRRRAARGRRYYENKGK